MAGTYQAYPEYKDSGIKWLGVIPKHWTFTTLKRYSSVQGGYAFNSDSFIDTGKAVIRIGDIKQDGSISLDSCKHIKSADAPKYGQYEVRSGDLLMAMTGATIGKAGWFRETESALLNQRVGSFKCNKSHLSCRFFWYLLNSSGYQEYIKLTAFGGAQPNISDTAMVGYQSALPFVAEQENIVNFLDHETAKIDTLIEKQQQLIKLLKEKRQAVISHAVTKGLNPSAPMRDSGVEWLGEVPEHWNVQRLRYLGGCQNGINIGAECFGSGYPFVSYSDAHKNEVLPEYGSGLIQSTERDRKEYSVVAGDVIFTRTSETVEEIGFSSTCLKTIKDASFAGFLIRFRPKQNVLDSGFSKYYFRNMLMRTFFIKEMNLVTRASLSQDLLKKLPVPLPPLNEQAGIAEFLDGKSAVFEKLTENADAAIELMQERRTALISAAVTGKIDVRNWQTPQPSNTNPCSVTLNKKGLKNNRLNFL